MADRRQTNILDTYQSLLSTFSDFLVVSIHTILYERGIYPPNTFLSARKYNFPVRQNRHPKVCQWILDAVAAVEAEMLKGTVSKVAVVIYSGDAQVLERFMFDVSSFPTVSPTENLTPFENVGSEETTPDPGKSAPVSLVDVEEQLRATVGKLAYCGSKLGPLPEGCTYTVVVELKEEAEPPLGHPQPWIPSVPSLQTGEKGSSNRIGRDLGGKKSLPVRAVEAGEFIFEMWIEEGEAKESNKT